jgi:DNA polymerase-3 subunit epsilon
MKRQVFIDTETTGLEVTQGHRLIEIAAIEMINRRLTGERFVQRINPDRPIDAGATRVHGITDEDVADAPPFSRIADALLDFVRDAEILIHNAPFDLGFLNEECKRAGRPLLDTVCERIVDTLKMARDLRPGKANSLEALCRAYEIDDSSRTFHGALLDAQLLSQVYLAMSRGQDRLTMPLQMRRTQTLVPADGQPLRVRVIRATEEEHHAHRALLEAIDQESAGRCVWAKSESVP